jgi:thiol-disulfide isomerase/thioredoxin
MYPRVIARVGLHGFVQSIFWFGLAAAAAAADRPATSVLHLTNGGFVAGELCASDDAGAFRWRSSFFAQPLEFPLSAVTAVNCSVPGPLPKPRGEYCFELVSGDLLYGDLLRATEEDIELNSARLGRIHLRHEYVRRFYRWKGDAIYVGPNGLAEWTEPDAPARNTAPHLAGPSGSAGRWREEGGQLVTDQAGASLFGDLRIPEKAVIEIELSWKRRPNFILALGVDGRDSASQRAFRIEVWGDEIVVAGESAREADVASVQEIGNGEGHVRIRAYLDQGQGRLLLVSGGGKPTASLNLRGKRLPIRSGIRLTNTKGDVRLEHLRVSRWNGLPPREAREDQSRLQRTDGTIVYGQLVAFDPQLKQFTIRDGTAETRVDQDAVSDVFPSKAADNTDAVKEQPTLRLVYRDGLRLSGTLRRSEDTHLTLSCPGVKEPLRLPLADLRSLIVQRVGEHRAEVEGKPGRLEMEGVSLKGRLVSGAEQPDASCLVWRPDLALNASPLRHGVSGRIVYRDPPPAPKPNPAVKGRVIMRQEGNVVIQQGNVVIQQMIRPDGRVIIQQVGPDGRIMLQHIANGPVDIRAGQSGTSGQPPSSGRLSLHLRSGDTIPCEVTRIDEKGVTFKTPLSNATFVPHEKIKSVELIATYLAPRMEDAKRDRLLTLPRLQKDSPPTHLICSNSGDFLRGRLLEMDETKLKVEVRLETREIPRGRVAQIIWLHADELTGTKAAAMDGDPGRARQREPRGAEDDKRVQALRADGNRMTFVAEKSDHKTIWGTSDILGACRADLEEVDQLLLGSYIEESAAKLAYHLWKLHYATEPKFAQDEAGAPADGRSNGTESPLVGQPAFAFRLDSLDGSKFQLASRKGRVVVVEFWATWCGPCLQSMPLVDGVVREFAERNVELVAVNMEEQPEQIKSMLERHKLKIPVVLDRDGAVAAKYAVTAIPQTVVIDREGKVVRLFVGGGKKTADSLRQALQELTADKATPAAGERGASAP